MEQEPKIESRRESLRNYVSELRNALKKLEIESGENKKINWAEVNQILYKLEKEAETK